MTPSTTNVADAELRVLQVLWDQQPVGAREITQAVYGGTSPSQIATVQKLLSRLETKKLVKRDRRGHVHAFSTRVDRATFAGRQLEEMADKLTEGSLVPFLTHLVQSKRVSKKELDHLRRLLEESVVKKKGERS